MAGRKTRKTEPVWPLKQRPGFLIRRLHQIHVALFQENCAKFEITPLQYSLLSALMQRGTADQSTLALDIALDRTTTTGALKRLQARGLIDRVTDRDDRRAQACRLTRRGAELLRTMEASVRDAHRATIAALGEADQKRFLVMMQTIVGAQTGQREGADTDQP